METRKMTWDELARENAGLKQQQALIVQGMAEMFPSEGWMTDPHPELGEMPEEFASHILSRVKRLREETEVERMRLAGCLTIAEGSELADDITEGHPYWSPALDSVRGLRQAAAMAIYLANKRAFSSKQFMEPENLAPTLHKEGATGVAWELLSDRVKKAYLQQAQGISSAYTKAMSAADTEADPEVAAILDTGNALSSAISMIEALRGGLAYSRLTDLDRFLLEVFPTLSWEGEDSALDAPRRAIDLLMQAKAAFGLVSKQLLGPLAAYLPPVPEPSPRPHRLDSE